ncbi:hypothetical protein EHJ08_14715 [Cronobacter sakazakii]|nr:hypothetical protein [Cronobacter sakazakii]
MCFLVIGPVCDRRDRNKAVRRLRPLFITDIDAIKRQVTGSPARIALDIRHSSRIKRETAEGNKTAKQRFVFWDDIHLKRSETCFQL